jgi:FkbH-like protein
MLHLELETANIKICGSSFLLPKNKGWQPLEQNFKLFNSEYGDISGALFNADSDDVVLIVLFFEDIVSIYDANDKLLSEKFSSLFNSISYRCANSNKPTVICWGKVFYTDPIRLAKKNTQEMNAFNWFIDQFQEMVKEHESLYFINLNQIYSQKGYENVFDERNWYFAHCRVSTLGINLLANSVNSVLVRHFKTSSKVLVLDCDNTIWGGVIGEDGIEGILLGQDGIGSAFVDFQREIKSLVDDGVILVLASKNNEEEVWNVFDSHPSMILKKSDVIAWRIDWKEKSENIKSIANELDLGLDSFVFLDDNPVERDKVRSILPQVVTVEMPNEVYLWPKLIRNLENFAKFKLTQDDRNKTKQYHGRAKFVRDSSKISDISAYLKGINLCPVATNLNDALLGRAVQLCSKTNQYNLRTVRHTAKELLNFSSFNNDFCFLISLTDIYGDHGVVALVCLQKLDDSLLFLDTLLMSCRVLGRYLEAWILDEIINRAKKYGFEYVVGEFIQTDRNVVSKDFFANYGFSQVNYSSKFYEIINLSKLAIGKDIFIFSIENSSIPYLDIYEKN